MATTEAIIARVVEIIQDGSFDEDAILEMINEGRVTIAAEAEPGLPYLRADATVTTTSAASSVALPTNYHRGLFWVGSASQKRRIGTRIGDYHNLMTFMERFPMMDAAGQIEAVCVDGTNLLYQGRANDTLTLKYFKVPEEIDIADIETATPAELPVWAQKPLLVAYCCREIYSIIEDGIEGPKTNTDHWEAMFSRAQMKLQKFIDESKPREPKYVRDLSGESL